MISRYLFSIFILFLATSTLFAGQNTAQFYTLTTKDGLSSNEVNCIFKDSKGFVWFGTKDGLNKYDGSRFTVYRNDPGNANSISDNRISSIVEDHAGGLWVGTAAGLNKFDRETESFFHFSLANRLKKNNEVDKVTLLFVDHSGFLWVNANSQLTQLDPTTGKSVALIKNKRIQKMCENVISFCIFEDKNNNLWIGFWDVGLLKLEADRNHSTFYSHQPNDPQSLASNNVTTIYEDKNRQLWIGSYLGGLCLFHPDNQKFTKVTNAIFGNEITGIVPVGEDQLWICQGHSVVAVKNLNLKTVIKYNHYRNDPNSFMQDYAHSMYKDNTGMLWFASYKVGVSFWNPNSELFSAFQQKVVAVNSNIDMYVRSFYLDDANNEWVGTYGNGLFQYNKAANKYTHIVTPKLSLNSDIITTICPLKSGELWVGTYNGISILNATSGKVLGQLNHIPTNPNSLKFNLILNIFQDSRNAIWVAMMGGLDLIEGGKFTHFTDNGLNQYQIYAILEDKRGDVWIASLYGLHKYDWKKKKFSHYFTNSSNKAGLNSAEVLSLYQDTKGRLWVGTRNGLNYYNPEENRFHSYSIKNAGRDLPVYGIVEENQHFYWLLNNFGLSRLNMRTAEIVRYDQKDGLKVSTDFLIKNKQGSIYVGSTQSGFYKFNPAQIKFNTTPPTIYISNLLLFNQSVPVEPNNKHAILQKHISYTSEISLNYDQSMLEFQLAAINFTQPEKNRFAYKLEEIDKDWNYLEAGKSSILFAHLNPGKYNLRIKGSNNDGVWNDKGVSLKIVILPPFWKTKWAYFAYFILIVSILFTARYYLTKRFREKSKSEIDQMKLQFFTNVSHELRTPLTLISGPLNTLITEVKQEVPTKKRLLDQFSLMLRNTDRLMLLINQLLDLQKSETGKLKLATHYGNIVPFLKSLFDAFEPMSTRKGIDYHFNTSAEAVETTFDPEKLEKIVFNLLSNAFKFSKSKIAMSLSVANGYLSIVIEDDGIGIAKEHLDKIFENFYQVDNSSTRKNEGSGIGLALTRELVLLHKGTIEVQSEVGKGTKMMVQLPVISDQLSVISHQATSDGFQAVDVEELPTTNYPLLTTNYNLPTTNYPLPTDLPLVLIVEDSADLRLYIRDVLGGTYQIAEAENGRLGVEKALEILPDLILSDLMMPEMDGMELCKTLKNDDRTSHIPIVLLTALSATDTKLEGLRTGADDYVTKPFHAELLLARIANLILMRKQLQQKFQQALNIEPKEFVNNVADEKLLKKAIALVEAHLEDFDFGIQQFIDGMNMSRTNLYVKIKVLTGQSVSDFIKSIRLRRAAQLLLSKEFTVSEICFKVGFQDRSQFYRAFKDHFLMTPTQYAQSK